MGYLQKISSQFEKDYHVHWSSLTFLNNSLVIVNITLFFVTELVKQGYFFTFFSLLCLGIVQLMILLPVGLLANIRYYTSTLIIEGIGIYFLVASVVYWLRFQ